MNSNPYIILDENSRKIYVIVIFSLCSDLSYSTILLFALIYFTYAANSGTITKCKVGRV